MAFDERPRAITETEIVRLEDLLAQSPAADSALPLDAMHGLIAAALSAPAAVDERRWLAIALGDLAPGEARSEIERIARRLYEDTAAGLFDGMGVDPIAPVDEDGRLDWRGWCEGYLEGTQLWERDWRDELMTDEDLAAPLALIEAAAGEGGTALDDAMARLAAELGARRVEPGAMIESAVQIVYDVNNERRRGTTLRRELPKVGRNDPCPCGSGRKYKQCHGKA